MVSNNNRNVSIFAQFDIIIDSWSSPINSTVHRPDVACGRRAGALPDIRITHEVIRGPINGGGVADAPRVPPIPPVISKGWCFILNSINGGKW